jgi:putative holliday junction resolvase
MARIMAIDFGIKRVGLAVTDPLQMIASPLQTVANSEIFDFLTNYFKNENVETIVVGYPVNLDNSPSETLNFVNPFVKKLEKSFPEKKIVLADERYTSKMAFQTMIDGGLKKKKRQDKSILDRISATIILQSYMETKNINI